MKSFQSEDVLPDDDDGADRVLRHPASRKDPHAPLELH
jgi:hypothetical protein